MAGFQVLITIICSEIFLTFPLVPVLNNNHFLYISLPGKFSCSFACTKRRRKLEHGLREVVGTCMVIS